MDVPSADVELRRALEDAGILGPRDSVVEGRFTACKLLLSRGATINDLRAYRFDLGLLAATLAQGGLPTLTSQQVAQRMGVTVELVERLLLAAGLPVTDPDVPSATEDDLLLFETFAVGSALYGEEVTLQLARVLGAATSRIADALNSAFIGAVEPEITRADPSGLGLVRANLDLSELFPSLMQAIGQLLHRQILHLARTSSDASIAAAGYESRDLLVGFVDIVGSTGLASRLDIAQLGAFLDEFESTAADIVVRNHGRVVKLMGDEILFTTSIPREGLAAAVELVEAFRDHPRLPPVRGGLAYGSVLTKDGDCYGPVVNLAARIVSIAPTGSILIDEVLWPHALIGEGDLESFGAHSLKGFADPVTLFRLTPGVEPQADVRKGS